MWSWILHRVTGLGVLFFLILHVVDTALVIYFPDLYDHALSIYKSGIFRFGELAIFFAVIYHSLNGLRIVVQDFWPVVMVRQRQMVWAAAIITAVAIIPIGWVMLAPIFGLAEEPGTARHIVRCQEHPTAVACIQEGSAESEEVGL
jgi:succinate dehydrogenase / fumarate reductase cytochrome b subunit